MRVIVVCKVYFPYRSFVLGDRDAASQFRTAHTVSRLFVSRPADSPIEIGGNAPSERNAQFLKTSKEYGVGNWEDANIKEIDITNM